MMALTTPAVVAIAVHWDITVDCGSIVVEVELRLSALVVESVVPAVVDPGMCGIHRESTRSIVTLVPMCTRCAQIVTILTYGRIVRRYSHINQLRRVTLGILSRVIYECDFTKKYKVRVILVGK
jgi:hypothetical protein